MSWRSRADVGAWWICVTGWATSALVIGVTGCVTGALWLGPARVGMLFGWASQTAFAFVRSARSTGRRAGNWTLSSTTACIAVAAVVLLGALQALGWSGAAIVVLLVVSGWLLHRWHTTWTRRAERDKWFAAALHDGITPVVTRNWVPATLLDAASVPQLCQLWRRSSVLLQQCTDPWLAARLVRARQSYLDELERRDPAGVQRWFEAAPTAALDPVAFLTSPRS